MISGHGRSDEGKSAHDAGNSRIYPNPNLRDLRSREHSASCQQPPSDQEQVAEGEQREQLRPVLRKATITGLEIPELALEHAEGMLDPSP